MHCRRVLVLSPHTDDAELGCGGTLARLAEAGAAVHAAVFSLAEDSLPPGAPPDTLEQECLAALPTLGVPRENVTRFHFPVRRFPDYRQEILEELIRLRRSLDPDLILLPAAGDLHQDHQVIQAEGMRAGKDRTVLGYELPWNHVDFAAEAFVRLERRHVERKWQALQCYRSQFDLGRPYFSPDFIEALARVRGTQIRTTWAEAFRLGRLVW